MKVKYDDQVTNFEAMVKELSKAGFEVEGQPEYLEPGGVGVRRGGAGSCLPPRYYIFDLLVTAETEPSRPVV